MTLRDELDAAVRYRAEQLGVVNPPVDRAVVRPWRDALISAISDKLNAIGTAVGLPPVRWELIDTSDGSVAVCLQGTVLEPVHLAPSGTVDVTKLWADVLGLARIEPPSRGLPPTYHGLVDGCLQVELASVQIS
nr:hypothetical protein [Kibdelosporangium sp. MJ126-NF4]CEL15077.1 hypothetical protein [Kibdelosporangium sp. MJ126-NF4]